MTAEIGGVALAYLHGEDVPTAFHNSIKALIRYDAQHGQHIAGNIQSYCSSEQVARSRNDTCARFLEGPCEWLFFTDADMAFPAWIVEAFLSVADPETRPVVGGLAFAQRIVSIDQDYQVPNFQMYATIYKFDGDSFANAHDYPRDSMVQCDGTGGACLFIHRSVLEKIRDKFGPNWFTKVVKDDMSVRFSEDLSFCYRLMILELPLHVHTGIKTKHAKTRYLDERMFDAQMAVQQDRPTVAVIPVKDRLSMTRALIEQLAEQGDCDAIYVYDNGSNPQTQRWLEAQDLATVFPAKGLGIHEMWNAGVEEALANFTEPNIFFLNNDIRLGDDCVGILAQMLRMAPADLVAASPNYDGRDYADQLEIVKGISAGRYDGTGGLAGFAFMVRGSFFANPYWPDGSPFRFPESMMWWYGDNFFTIALDRHQPPLNYAIARNATVEHLDGGSQTIGKPGEHDPKVAEQIDRDRDEFVRLMAERFGIEVKFEDNAA